jgi:hypothetical protein
VSVADLFERVRSADERYPAVAALDEVPHREFAAEVVVDGTPSTSTFLYNHVDHFA